MTRSLRGWVALLGLAAALISAAPARAEPPLSLADVLESLAARYPLILAEDAAVDAARGEARAARGAFDPNLSVQGRAAVSGYYDPRRLDVVVEQPTPLLGASLYAGYRLTRGKVAPYYWEQRTLDRGEVRAGVRIPLLEDRAMDARRAGVRASEASAEAAEARYEELRLDLELSAAQAYFAWVSAGHKLRVTDGLVSLAVERKAQLDELVAHGALPEIEALDNQRAILERKRQRVAAERALEKAALDLSLFLRAEDGSPRVVSARELPPELVDPVLPSTLGEEGERRALATRPELAAYAAEVRAAEVDRQLAEARVVPRLDAFGEVSRDFGTSDDASFAATLAPTGVEVGATLSVPLALRRARGKLAAAEAKLRGSRQKASFAADKVRTEVRDARSQLAAATERIVVAREVVDAASRVAQGERERFGLGASTVLFVNMREQQAADAQLALIDAQAEAHYAAVRVRTVEGTSTLATR